MIFLAPCGHVGPLSSPSMESSSALNYLSDAPRADLQRNHRRWESHSALPSEGSEVTLLWLGRLFPSNRTFRLPNRSCRLPVRLNVPLFYAEC